MSQQLLDLSGISSLVILPSHHPHPPLTCGPVAVGWLLDLSLPRNLAKLRSFVECFCHKVWFSVEKYRQFRFFLLKFGDLLSLGTLALNSSVFTLELVIGSFVKCERAQFKQCKLNQSQDKRQSFLWQQLKTCEIVFLNWTVRSLHVEKFHLWSHVFSLPPVQPETHTHTHYSAQHRTASQSETAWSGCLSQDIKLTWYLS